MDKRIANLNNLYTNMKYYMTVSRHFQFIVEFDVDYF